MDIEQRQWTQQDGWRAVSSGPSVGSSAELAFVFGSTGVLSTAERIRDITEAFPRALLFGCSTAGEICGTRVSDESLVVTAVRFDRTRVRGASIHLKDVSSSEQTGARLAQALEPNGLAHVLVLSDGLKVNGSELVKGLTAHLPAAITVTGGLSGDGARFAKTLVFEGGTPSSDVVAVVGLYGDRLKIGYGSLGGWDPFGPERLITKSTGNMLYELDGTSALELYQRYLGEHAKGLPATGLLFPLCLRTQGGETGVVRTILSVSEQDQSITFAGDVPEGAYVRFMKANFDRLIDGAVGAAKTCHEALNGSSPDLALLISCVGRKLVLQQRIEEEVEGVRDVLGARTTLTGFYSYGEISPFTPRAKCELHNQTMTITTLSER